jgi:hypothetical protein
MSGSVLYAAGLFEGEGCVSIARERRGGGVEWFHLAVVVKMGDREPLDMLLEQWQGNVYALSSPSTPANRRPMFSWQVCARQAAAFLADIRPYLLSARRQRAVDLAIAFQAQKVNAGRCATYGYRLRQADYYERMRVLNRRGAAAAVDVGELLRSRPEEEIDGCLPERPPRTTSVELRGVSQPPLDVDARRAQSETLATGELVRSEGRE